MRVFRVALASTVLAAIAVQLYHEVANERFNAVNFFSFFTIVCNTFGAFALLAVAFGLPSDARARDLLRGAATLYLAIVGIVFSLLLANLESVLIPWVNAIVHVVMPASIALDWCLDPPKARLSLRDAVVWLPLPAAYVAYTLIRGAVVHWYPYPFLNADAIGYPAVFGYVAGITVFTVVLATIVISIGDTLRKRKITTARPASDDSMTYGRE